MTAVNQRTKDDEWILAIEVNSLQFMLYVLKQHNASTFSLVKLTRKSEGDHPRSIEEWETVTDNIVQASAFHLCIYIFIVHKAAKHTTNTTHNNKSSTVK